MAPGSRWSTPVPGPFPRCALRQDRHLDEVWTPGANWATTLEVSKDVRVNDRPLAAGKYSVWFVVKKDGPWTVVLDPKHRLYHTMHPDSSAQQIRFAVQPGSTPFSEALTWSFSEIQPGGATLAMEWGTVRVPIGIAVTRPLPSPRRRTKPRPISAPTRTPGPEARGREADPVHHDLRERLDDGTLGPAPFPEWDRFIMIGLSADTFIPGFLEKGKLYDIEREMVFEFKRDGGRVHRVQGPRREGRSDRRGQTAAHDVASH
jgi:hypothetical protein